jgi:hypothetical protein
MSIREWIRDWLLRRDGALLASNRVEVDAQEGGTQISISDAINGRVLTIRTCRPNHPQYASNWVTELYLVPEGESLPDALTMLLLMKGMK